MQVAAGRQINQRLLPEAGPKTLAVLRIAAGLATVWFAVRSSGFVVPPEPLRFPPSMSFLPVSPAVFQAAIWVALGSAIALVAGWRPAAWVALVAVFYAGWVPTVTGKVDHIHHIMWILLIVAVAPSANAWSLWKENRKGSYALPVFAVILLIGLIYFGAGVAKLQDGGLAWGWSDNLVNRMWNMAWEKDLPVRWWLVDYPIVGRVAGTVGLLFELSFLPLVIWPKTRRFVWPAGLMFHWGTWIILGIPFLTLQLMYVVFIPWDRSYSEGQAVTHSQRVVTSSLVGVVAVFALLGIEWGWPVASYPAFAGVADHNVTGLEANGVRSADLDAAQLVGAHRLVVLSSQSIRNGYAAELAAWLDAEHLAVVTVDSTTGAVLSSTRVYP